MISKVAGTLRVPSAEWDHILNVLTELSATGIEGRTAHGVCLLL